jgi:hypothetical protein
MPPHPPTVYVYAAAARPPRAGLARTLERAFGSRCGAGIIMRAERRS